MQRVLGFNTRLPNSLWSDAVIDPRCLNEGPPKDFQRSEELRRAATRVWVQLIIGAAS